nr:PTS fructose transporter subunit IIB [Cardiobacterium sp. Marseille-Q4385]
MAQEALEIGARALGHEVKIETQGSVGAANVLTPQDIARADVVIIAADTNVDPARFAGKRLYRTGTKAAINDAAKVINTASAKRPSSPPTAPLPQRATPSRNAAAYTNT